jgi:hypothetical protein
MKVERSGDSFDLDEFLARPLIAHFATASADGPCESPLWFLWEEGSIWFIGTTRDSFPKRVEDEPRCAISFVDFALERGVLLHVGTRGSATVTALDDGRLHRLLRRYLGEDRARWHQAFVQAVIDKIDLTVRFVPGTVVMRDQSYFK